MSKLRKFRSIDAEINALDAHTSMSSKVLNSTERQRELLKLLLEMGLWEKLREKAS